MPQSNRSRRSKRNQHYTIKNGRGNALSQLTENADHKMLGDNTILSLQDRFDSSQNQLVPSSIPKSIARQCYWYKGSYTLTQLVSSPSVPVAQSYTFNVAGLNDASSLSAVFDQYAIVAATVRIMPQDNFATSATNRPGTLISVIDHDDASGLVSLAQAQEYATKLETAGTIGHTRVLMPRVAAALYGGSAFTSYGNTRMYIDAASLSVPHYGVKAFASQSAGQAFVYDVVVELVVHWRDSH